MEMVKVSEPYGPVTKYNKADRYQANQTKAECRLWYEQHVPDEQSIHPLLGEFCRQGACATK